MNNCKIRVNNEAESREAQELFFELGYAWFSGKSYTPIAGHTHLTTYTDGTLAMGTGDAETEINLPQLRDLVVLHRNDVGDATHTHKNFGRARSIILSATNEVCDWVDGKWKVTCRQISELKPLLIETGLISGADALIAIGKGECVQYSFDDDKFWQNDIANLKIADFGGGHYEFRLKPRTIKLEIEIPAPFEPEFDERFFFIDSNYPDGFNFSFWQGRLEEKCRSQFGVYRTEAEIKIVVEQLRKLKEHSK